MINNLVNIDFTKTYTFGQVLDEVSKDSTLSFISKGRLYFKKDGKFRTCLFKEDYISGVPYVNELVITDKLFEQSYLKTDIHISDIVTQIDFSDVKKSLQAGKIVMFSVGQNTWVLELEDNVVYLDYAQVEGATADNYLELYARDSIAGFVDGIYHVIEEDHMPID